MGLWWGSNPQPPHYESDVQPHRPLDNCNWNKVWKSKVQVLQVSQKIMTLTLLWECGWFTVNKRAIIHSITISTTMLQAILISLYYIVHLSVYGFVKQYIYKCIYWIMYYKVWMCDVDLGLGHNIPDCYKIINGTK